MKSIFRILILAVVPILMVTAVVDQGLAADKGSQLIFHSNMYHQNYISVTNGDDGSAVTVLVQYYNDEMAMVLYYLRVIPGAETFWSTPSTTRFRARQCRMVMVRISRGSETNREFCH